MATIEKRTLRNGELRYKITVAVGVGVDGKQRRVHKMWQPPREGMTERQIEKALNRAVSDFEREVEQGYHADHNQRFADYAQYVLALKQRTGVKVRTIGLYTSMLDRINHAIGHLKLVDIRPQHLNAFYENLGEKGVRRVSAKATIKFDLRTWLSENNYTGASLARKTKLSETTISALCKGRRVSYESAVSIATAIGKPIDQLFETEVSQDTLSAKTILEYHRLISSILAQAEKELLIPYNPAAKATPPKPKKAEPDYYQPEELDRIISALETAPQKWKAMTYLLIDTGCRRGEIVGLKWDCLDIESGIITVERALLYTPKKGVYEDTTKTGNTRVMRIAPETLAAILEWRQEQDYAKETYGSEWIDSGYIFTQDNGMRMHPDSLTNWHRKFSRQNSLPHIHPHAFRHTVASMMIASGVDVVTTANELGHASAVTTTTIYAHQIDEAKARAENIRASVFRRKTP